ncbi:MAG: hypothetical protein RLZZ197_413, partial [Bacteroidota bacterium]
MVVNLGYFFGHRRNLFSAQGLREIIHEGFFLFQRFDQTACIRNLVQTLSENMQ